MMQKKMLADKTIQVLKEKIIPVLKKHDVVKAGLFGSVARGEQTQNSDIDVLIEFNPITKKSLFDLVHVKLEIEEKLGKKVDVGEYHTIKPRLKDRIMNEEITIFPSMKQKVIFKKTSQHKRDISVYIEEITESISLISSYTEGMGKEDFINNCLIQEAVAFRLELLAEAAKNIPGEYRKKHPELNWQSIAGFAQIIGKQRAGN